jgi:hypothetical protein
MTGGNLSPVFIITDFRETDTYVGQMRAVMMDLAGPDLPMADLTHSVGRGDVREGLFHLSRALPWLPRPSVVLAVVDPGVGSARRPVAVRTEDVWLVGPDNGLLLPHLAEEARLLPVGEDSSATFHGRDVFAPAAARTAADPSWPEGLEEVAVDDLVRLPGTGCTVSDGAVSTSVAHVDRFGNVVLWMEREDLPAGGAVRVRPGEGEWLRASAATHYSGGSGLLILEGSQGLMELAVDGGSAAELTGLEPGDAVGILREDR